MARVLVTGASGILGTAVSQELGTRGHDVVRASRRDRPGFVRLDLPGATEAPVPADAVVHCAADIAHAAAVEVEGLRTLRRLYPDARIVYPSIVGCDRIRFSYYRVKTRAERALREVGGDHAVLRITQFHEFADRLARLPVPMVFAGMRSQPIAVTDAARALVDVVEGDAQGLVGNTGGPETHRMVDLVRQRMRVEGRRRPILRLPLGYRGFRAGHNLCPDDRVGTITWAEHLEATR